MKADDSSVLGGVRMQIGSKVWDDTIKGRLDDLRRFLYREGFDSAARQEEGWLERWDDDGGAPPSVTRGLHYLSPNQPELTKY